MAAAFGRRHKTPFSTFLSRRREASGKGKRMNLPLSASDLCARWSAVAEREAEERRCTPVDVRWQQLNALIAFAQELGLEWRRRDEMELAEVRCRWAKIKERDGRKH